MRLSRLVLAAFPALKRPLPRTKDECASLVEKLGPAAEKILKLIDQHGFAATTTSPGAGHQNDVMFHYDVALGPRKKERKFEVLAGEKRVLIDLARAKWLRGVHPLDDTTTHWMITDEAKIVLNRAGWKARLPPELTLSA